MKKVILFLLSILMLCIANVPLSAQDGTLTVYEGDGMETNHYVPANIYWFDDFTRSQFVIPSADLTAMSGNAINSMKFYTSISDVPYTTVSQVDVYLKEVTHTSINAFETKASSTVVYSGTLNIVRVGSGGELTIEFNDPYIYNGGNLMVGIENTTDAGWKNIFFIGQIVSGASIAGWNSDGLEYIVNGSQQNFIPKTTFFYSTPAQCASPTDVTATAITTSTATISWTGNPGIESYTVRYMPAYETNWDAAAVVTETGTSTVLAGLTPGTFYKVRVMGTCTDGSPTLWSSVCDFTTICAPISIEEVWHEGFEGYSGSGAQPFICWIPSVNSNGGGDGPFVYCNDGRRSHTGRNSAELRAQLNYTNVLLLPEFTNDIHTLRLSFWATSTNPNSTEGRLEVGVVTNEEPSTFELVGVCGTPGERGDYNTENGVLMGPFDFDNVQAADGRIALRFFGDGTSDYYTLSWNLDDFMVTFVPECPEPTQLTTVNASAHQAVVTWTDEEDLTYDVLCWVDGGTDTIKSENVTLTNGTFTIGNLLPNKLYYWTARTNCPGGTHSNAIQVPTFRTPNVPVELEYYQDFETNSESISDFTFISGTGENEWKIGAAEGKPDENGGTSVHSMYISNDGGISNAYTWNSPSDAYAVLNVEFPNDLVEYHFDFDYKVNGELSYDGDIQYDYFSVYLLDYDAVLPDYIDDMQENALLYKAAFSNGWQHFSSVLLDVVGTSKKIVFYWHDDTSQGTNPPAAIDNVSITISSCAQPSSLVANNVSDVSATVRWTENATSTSWTFYYKKADEATDYQAIPVSSTPMVELTSLDANTRYECYAVANCGETPSAPSAHYIFKTACSSNGITSLPFEEDFEGELEGDYVPCWTRSTSDPTGGHQVSVNVNDIYAWGSKCLDFGYTPNCYTQAVLPKFASNISLGTLQVEFDARRAGTEGSFQFGVMTDPNDDGTFVVLATIETECTGPNLNYCDWEHFTIYCNDYHGNGHYFAFRATNCGSSPRLIDNVKIDRMATCAAPEYNSVQISNVTSTTAVVSFTDNAPNHNAWMIYYRPESSTGEYQTQSAVVTTGTPIEGLLPNTTYTVFVKTVCSDIPGENQTGEKTFTTMTVPATLPFHEDFEDQEDLQWVLLNENQMNKWYIGAPTDLNSYVNTTVGGSNGLYISSDYGFSNTYEYDYLGYDSYVYAYRDVFVPDGTTELLLTFDWKANGRSAQEEFLRVYWVDPSVVTITPGMPLPVINGVFYDQAAQPGNYGPDGSEHYLSRSTEWQHTEMRISASQFDGMGTGDRVYRLVFHWREATTYEDWPLDPPAAVDEVLLRALHCAAPTNVAVSDVSAHSVTLTWEGDAEQYAVYVTGHETTYQIVTGNTATLSLASGTHYVVTMRAFCDGDSSALSSAVSFNTECEPYTVTSQAPWTENFESYSGLQQTLPLLCWETPAPTTFDDITYPVVMTQTPQAAHSGSNTVEMKASVGTFNMAVLPEFTNDIHDLRLSFWATSSNPSSVNGYMEVGVLSGNNFEVLDTVGTPGARNSQLVSGNGNYVGTFDFRNVTATSGRIALRLQGDGYNTANSLSWNIDDIIVELIPNCPSPEKDNVTITNIGAYEATVSFVDNDPTHNSWTVWYQEVGEEAWYPVNTGTTTATIQGLDPLTNYYVYVVTNCEVSDPVADATFTEHFMTTVACPMPTNVMVVATDTMAVVTWEGDADNYTVSCGSRVQTVAGNMAVINGLTPSSDYTVMIMANCGGDGVSTIVTADFNTACSVVNQFTYTEDFNDDLGCWTNQNLTSNELSSANDWEQRMEMGEGCAYFPYTPGASARLVSPIFDLTSLDNPYLSFYHKQEPWTYGVSTYVDSLVVCYRSSLTSDWVRLQNFSSATSMLFQLDSLALPNPSSQYQICFIGYGTNGMGIYLNEVSVHNSQGAPPYQAPTVATEEATDVTAYSAVLHGTIHNPSNETIEMRGFAWKVQGASSYGPPVVCQTTEDSFSVTIENLEPNTTYVYEAFIVYGTIMEYGGVMTFTTADTTILVVPSVVTGDVTDTTQTTATLHATITNPDNVAITGKGFLLKVTDGGTYAPVEGEGTGNTFTANLTELEPVTNYTYKAYVSTADTTVYGAEKAFTTLEIPCPMTTSVTVGEVTKESISLSWDDNELIDHWHVQYRVLGTEAWSYANAETNSFTITGLFAETAYEIEVQSACSVTNLSEWTTPITVTTKPDGLQERLASQIVLYPNPAKEVVNVQCTMNNVQFEVTGVEVFDVFGKLINTVDVVENPTRINVSGLADGMYFVRVTTDQGAVTKTFVKR